MIRTERVILLDSSILLMPISGKKRNINLDELLWEITEGAQMAVLETTLEELERLKKQRGKIRLAADFALEYLSNKSFRVIKVDDVEREAIRKLIRKYPDLDFYDLALLYMAKKLGYAVATNDFTLVKKLRREGVLVYYFSGYKWMRFSGYQP